MIAGRAEITFANPVPHERGMSFNVVLGEETVDRVSISLLDLPLVAQAGCEEPYGEWGPKIFKVFDRDPDDPEAELLEWFTTEKLLQDRWRCLPGIEGFDNFRAAATYDLLYVGIAKVGDSFSRLIAKGHKKRQEILANEPQRRPGARVSDETYLFMFRANPLVIQTFIEFDDDDDAGSYLTAGVDQKRIIADAEKAFVSLLEPSYNDVKFKQYPKGTDGLYGSEYARYGYVLGENLVFNTDRGTFFGAFDFERAVISNAADMIFVDGDNVTLVHGDPSYGT